MPEITFENVKPLIAGEEIAGRTLQYVFACPVTGEQFAATHTLDGTPDAAGQIKARVKRSIGFSLRGPIASAIRSAFGYNNPIGRLIGDVGSHVAYVATTPAAQGSGMAFSGKQKRAAAVAAFRTVASRFAWDPERSSWISVGAAEQLASPFERQVREHGLEFPYDREVAARMLVEVAIADGIVTGEERDFLESFIDPTIGSLESLSERPPLSAAELSETTSSVRETMLMLAWLIALADESFDASEDAALQRFAEGLGATGVAESARSKAQGHLIEQALDRVFDSSGHNALTRDALLALADRIGMSRTQAELVEARFQKRRGLVA